MSRDFGHRQCYRNIDISILLGVSVVRQSGMLAAPQTVQEESKASFEKREANNCATHGLRQAPWNLGMDDAMDHDRPPFCDSMVEYSCVSHVAFTVTAASV